MTSTARCLLHNHFNPCRVGNRRLTKVPQNIGMEQYIRSTLIRNHEAEAFRRIEPLYSTGDARPVIVDVGHLLHHPSGSFAHDFFQLAPTKVKLAT